MCLPTTAKLQTHQRPILYVDLNGAQRIILRHKSNHPVPLRTLSHLQDPPLQKLPVYTPLRIYSTRCTAMNSSVEAIQGGSDQYVEPIGHRDEDDVSSVYVEPQKKKFAHVRRAIMVPVDKAKQGLDKVKYEIWKTLWLDRNMTEEEIEFALRVAPTPSLRRQIRWTIGDNWYALKRKVGRFFGKGEEE